MTEAARGGPALPASIDRSAPGRCPLPCTGASWAAAPRGAYQPTGVTTAAAAAAREARI